MMVETMDIRRQGIIRGELILNNDGKLAVIR